MKTLTMFYILSFLFSPACISQKYDAIPVQNIYGQYKVGYKTICYLDYSRTTVRKTNYFGETNAENNRVIKMHIWYPAVVPKKERPITYRKYIEETALCEENSDGFAPKSEVAVNGYKDYLLQRNSDTIEVDRLLDSRTGAYWQARNAPGMFPLIIYAPSINSDPFENSVMFEFLASHGYVIVSSPCYGQFSPEMSKDVQGAETQLRDMAFLMNKCTDYSFIDLNNIIAAGYSWGGTTATLLACYNSNIEGVISFDGALGFEEYYGTGSSFSAFNANNLIVPYLWFMPASEKRTTRLFDFIKYGDLSMIRINGIRHSDFSSDRIIKKKLISPTKETENGYLSDVYVSLCESVLDFSENIFSAESGICLAIEEGSNEFIKRNAEIIVKRKQPLPPTENEFLGIIRERGTREAVRIFSEIRDADSTACFFSETVLTGFAYEYGPERAQELIDLMQMNIKVYPLSVESMLWLVQAYMALDRYDEAWKHLGKIRLLEPENEKALKLSEMLRSIVEK